MSTLKLVTSWPSPNVHVLLACSSSEKIPWHVQGSAVFRTEEGNFLCHIARLGKLHYLGVPFCSCNCASSLSNSFPSGCAAITCPKGLNVSDVNCFTGILTTVFSAWDCDAPVLILINFLNLSTPYNGAEFVLPPCKLLDFPTPQDCAEIVLIVSSFLSLSIPYEYLEATSYDPNLLHPETCIEWSMYSNL